DNFSNLRSVDSRSKDNLQRRIPHCSHRPELRRRKVPSPPVDSNKVPDRRGGRSIHNYRSMPPALVRARSHLREKRSRSLSSARTNRKTLQSSGWYLLDRRLRVLRRTRRRLAGSEAEIQQWGSNSAP